MRESGGFHTTILDDGVSWWCLAASENGGTNIGTASKFALDHDVNAKLYLWRGTPWALEVDAVVNSSNEVSIVPTLFFLRLFCLAYSPPIVLLNVTK